MWKQHIQFSDIISRKDIKKCLAKKKKNDHFQEEKKETENRNQKRKKKSLNTISRKENAKQPE